MTDREMLELAAKAAGVRIDKSEANGGGIGSDGFCITGDAMLDWHNNIRWNPLKNDGDALRLAVKLGVLLDVRYKDPALQRHNRVTYWIDPAHGMHVQFDDFGTDLASATRRAIVRAAAEIGKALD